MAVGIIHSFKGSYGYLSNFSPHSFKVKGLKYKSVEHFFQASKATNDRDHDEVRQCATAGEAKKMGNRISIRDDWDQVKCDIMLKGLRKKFKTHPDIAESLVKTGSRILIEGNTWGDTYWGQVLPSSHDRMEFGEGRGLNMLGVLLMLVRQELGGGYGQR